MTAKDKMNPFSTQSDKGMRGHAKVLAQRAPSGSRRYFVRCPSKGP